MENSFIPSYVKDGESEPSNFDDKKFIKSGLNPYYVSGVLVLRRGILFSSSYW
jgi:hypothetical protein